MELKPINQFASLLPELKLELSYYLEIRDLISLSISSEHIRQLINTDRYWSDRAKHRYGISSELYRKYHLVKNYYRYEIVFSARTKGKNHIPKPTEITLNRPIDEYIRSIGIDLQSIYYFLSGDLDPYPRPVPETKLDLNRVDHRMFFEDFIVSSIAYGNLELIRGCISRLDYINNNYEVKENYGLFDYQVLNAVAEYDYMDIDYLIDVLIVVLSNLLYSSGTDFEDVLLTNLSNIPGEENYEDRYDATFNCPPRLFVGKLFKCLKIITSNTHPVRDAIYKSIKDSEFEWILIHIAIRSDDLDVVKSFVIPDKIIKGHYIDPEDFYHILAMLFDCIRFRSRRTFDYLMSLYPYDWDAHCMFLLDQTDYLNKISLKSSSSGPTDPNEEILYYYDRLITFNNPYFDPGIDPGNIIRENPELTEYEEDPNTIAKTLFEIEIENNNYLLAERIVRLHPELFAQYKYSLIEKVRSVEAAKLMLGLYKEFNIEPKFEYAQLWRNADDDILRLLSLSYLYLASEEPEIILKAIPYNLKEIRPLFLEYVGYIEKNIYPPIRWYEEVYYIFHPKGTLRR